MGMDFRSAGDRVRSLIAAKKPYQLSASALTPDALRDNVIEEAEEMNARFRNSVEQAPEVEYRPKDADGNPGEPKKFTWDTWGEAVRDVARAGYGWDEPELRDRETIKPSHLFNRDVTSAILNHEKFQESRPYTRNNELESMFGAMALAEDMRANAAEIAAQHIARSEEMREAEQDQQDADQLLENIRSQAKAQKDEFGIIDPNLVDQAKAAVAKRQQAKQSLGNLVQQHKRSNHVQAAQKLAESAVQAQAQAVSDMETLSSLPGFEPGSSRNLKPDRQLALAEKWMRNPAMRELIRMAGRLIRDLRFKRETRTKNVPIEPVDVTTGRDLGRLMPHEYAQAFRPDTRIAWLDRYAKRALLEYEYEGKEPAGKGPLIVMMDCSGSMDMDFGGASRREWAGSLGLALCTLARRESRPFAGIHFGSHSELRTWLWPKKGDIDPEEVMEYVTHTFGGGTDTTIGFAEAMRICENEPEFKTADIILIGDGQDSFAEDDNRIIKRLRDDLHVRVHAISIACTGNRYMQQAAEYVMDVSDIADSDSVTSRLGENIT